jgi:hypothetical protein
MRGVLIATLAALATLSGCVVEPQPRPSIATPSGPASPAVVPPTTPPPTSSPVVPDETKSPTAAAPAPPKANGSIASSSEPPAARNPPPATPSSPKVSAPPPTPPAIVAAPVQPPASPTLDLTALEQRLRDTHAIGVFTKLSLKNQVNDLLEQFREFHDHKINVPLADLRERYEHLLLEVITLLQDADAQLASSIASSREAIWGILADPKSFAKI